MRLLQFDDLFQSMIAILDRYDIDLTRMSSSDIDSVLADHPEVAMFHRRNMQARSEVQNALDAITKITPKHGKASMLPLPDLE